MRLKQTYIVLKKIKPVLLNNKLFVLFFSIQVDQL